MKKKKKTPENEYLEQLQRLQAEFINYRNRIEKEKEIIKENTKNTILEKFLDVKENFERAPKLDEGTKLIFKQLQKIFAEENVEEVETKVFNPNLHEAIATVDTVKKDVIVEVLQKGYTRKDQILRPAKVVVGIKQEEKKNE